MSDVEFQFNGLDELMEEIKEAERKVPDISEKVLKKGMNKVRKLSKEKHINGKKGKKHINSSYKILPVEYESGGLNVKMTNTCPHFHLVERGHRLVTKSGKEIGFVQGKHMVERSMEEMGEEFPKMLEKEIKKILK
ncbi:HK97 gp10 family phage protein [Clostridium niameyense]|uniref:HK97 gp10 family phage protein n=1 Tax=Clostridium niameyense TaxID=1622073 RepID=A0A6M0RCL4_9CLOT|nr:HK97 gp10 family phage protein [Clostridium niameyense]NEZ47964.1 HK97 gp10 family phage protein [Clostridium niameyense]